MRDFILFIDTETTGIPLDWHAPYTADHKWPHAVQIAWTVYTSNGQEVKSENHYVYEPGITLSDTSVKIHGLTSEFLKLNGEEPGLVLLKLARDLEQYQPMVVGHFMQLDYHMMGASFYRAGLENPLLQFPLFCTMRASSTFYLPPYKSFLHLGELHERLFRKPMEKQHDAAIDARATADCFLS